MGEKALKSLAPRPLVEEVTACRFCGHGAFDASPWGVGELAPVFLLRCRRCHGATTAYGAAYSPAVTPPNADPAQERRVVRTPPPPRPRKQRVSKPRTPPSGMPPRLCPHGVLGVAKCKACARERKLRWMARQVPRPWESRTVCKNGHALTSETRTRKAQCVLCRRQRNRRHRLAQANAKRLALNGVYQHGTPKLTPQEIRTVLARKDAGERVAALVHEYGVTKSTIYRWANLYRR